MYLLTMINNGKLHEDEDDDDNDVAVYPDCCARGMLKCLKLFLFLSECGEFVGSHFSILNIFFEEGKQWRRTSNYCLCCLSHSIVRQFHLSRGNFQSMDFVSLL